MLVNSLFITTLLNLGGCLSENLDGESFRAAAFSDPPSAVSVLNFGGTKWIEVDVWVAWSGPATLKSAEGFEPCTDTKGVAAHFARKDPARAAMLADTTNLTCLEKLRDSGDREIAVGRRLLSHSSGVHWWRAWHHG